MQCKIVYTNWTITLAEYEWSTSLLDIDLASNVSKFIKFRDLFVNKDCIHEIQIEVLWQYNWLNWD